MKNIEDKLTNEEYRIYKIIQRGAIDNIISYGTIYDKDGENLTSSLNRILKELVEKKIIKWDGSENYIRLLQA